MRPAQRHNDLRTETSDVCRAFVQCLAKAHDRTVPLTETFHALSKLSCEHAQTHQPMNRNLKSIIEVFACKNLDLDDIAMVRATRAMVVSLGLKQVYTALKGSLTTDVPNDVYLEIQGLMHEVGDLSAQS